MAAVAGDAENIKKQARKMRINWIKNKQAANGLLSSPAYFSFEMMPTEVQADCQLCSPEDVEAVKKILTDELVPKDVSIDGYNAYIAAKDAAEGAFWLQWREVARKKHKRERDRRRGGREGQWREIPVRYEIVKKTGDEHPGEGRRARKCQVNRTKNGRAKFQAKLGLLANRK